MPQKFKKLLDMIMVVIHLVSRCFGAGGTTAEPEQTQRNDNSPDELTEEERILQPTNLTTLEVGEETADRRDPILEENPTFQQPSTIPLTRTPDDQVHVEHASNLGARNPESPPLSTSFSGAQSSPLPQTPLPQTTNSFSTTNTNSFNTTYTDVVNSYNTYHYETHYHTHVNVSFRLLVRFGERSRLNDG
ncbi:hypothetical protein CVT26_013746 [Gymnopilus dilepis]|uniref:Uncharacterized protein n=1 Tax=Gymnopilus dilepis TaxID=231916 RepID=A0A409X5R1_9AGAR|nr:hypothetical protein CVT26_013746 [Gymnopilus dilepis]